MPNNFPSPYYNIPNQLIYESTMRRDFVTCASSSSSGECLREKYFENMRSQECTKDNPQAKALIHRDMSAQTTLDQALGQSVSISCPNCGFSL